MASKPIGQARKGRSKRRGIRKSFPQVLVVCQGKVTEPDYFSRLKAHYRQPFEIKSVAKGLKAMVKEAVRIQTREDYDEVYVVVDVDDTSKSEFDEAISICCRNHHGSIHLIVSNPCFEYWLLMHSSYKTGPRITSEQAQLKAIELGLVNKDKPKEIDISFPLTEFEQAAQNGRICDPNEVGQTPSTAMPHAVNRLTKLKQ